MLRVLLPHNNSTHVDHVTKVAITPKRKQLQSSNYPVYNNYFTHLHNFFIKPRKNLRNPVAVHHYGWYLYI